MLKGISLFSPSKTPRRHRLAVEYCLVVAIAGFATVSTFSAINVKQVPMSSERVAVDRQ
ncbi:MAG: hypothetical protein AB7O88_20695 [Reyranellaceae bacterium]